MGFVTPGQQYFVMAAVVVFLFIAVIWPRSRPIQPRAVRGARVLRSRALGVRTRKDAPAQFAPLPALERGMAERGATTPPRPTQPEAKPKGWINFSDRPSPPSAGGKPAHGA